MKAALSLAPQVNPYRASIIHSSYANWHENKLVRVFNTEQKLSPQAEYVHDNFRRHVANQDFPCIGAKAAVNGNCYRFGFYPKMNQPKTTAGLAHDLWTYAQEQSTFKTNYATFIASFALPVVADEMSWEKLLWTQLENLHELDRKHYSWDKTVSSNPEDSDFSFSFAETGFFVVGLHPASSRLSRRFQWATLVFNTHAQFERLREENLFERMQQTIRDRDLKLQGSLNPNLSDFGKQSEAKQYSGRAVEDDWKCPFHAKLKEKSGK
ncbi:MAG: YqcI/YcgG family protein [Acidobacteriota bacterium]|nr:YqcI/YcgG family protein [Acidobacteriota bacterium]